jgi:hypothetical protein
MHQSRDHVATTFVCTRFTVIRGAHRTTYTRAHLTAVLALVLIHPRSTVPTRPAALNSTYVHARSASRRGSFRRARPLLLRYLRFCVCGRALVLQLAWGQTVGINCARRHGWLAPLVLDRPYRTNKAGSLRPWSPWLSPPYPSVPVILLAPYQLAGRRTDLATCAGRWFGSIDRSAGPCLVVVRRRINRWSVSET